MPTLFKLQPDSPPLDLDRSVLQRSLPVSMKVEDRDDGMYVVVDSADQESEDAQHALDRELDRIFFITCVRVTAEMCRKTVSRTLSFRWDIQGRLPLTIQPQRWTPELALQLRLWRTAVDATDSSTKIILLFQIVELTYPDTNNQTQYPQYDDPSCSPHPRTEAKLLRHLVSHAGKPTGAQTENYLKYLSLAPVLSDRTNPNFLLVVQGKVPHVETIARQVIESAL